MVGGSEPKIAFIAKDVQGDINLYVDGFFTGEPRSITKILLPEGDSTMEIKWSPDGRKLVFTNHDENQELWVFVYDSEENDFQRLYKVPAGRYVSDYKWSADHYTFIMQTVNARCCEPGWAYFQINFADGNLERVQGDGFWINSVSRANSQSICFVRTKQIQRMQSAGYREVCYFPEIGLYGGLKYEEHAVEYYLLSEDGQVQKTLLRFPTDFGTNGAIDLLLSPDKSRVLMIGEPLRLLGRDTERGIPFAIPISMTDISVGTAEPETLFYSGPIYEATPPPHELMSKLVYGWSPDSRSYLEARFFFDGYDRVNFTGRGEIIVINADSEDAVYSYDFPSDVVALITPYGSGFDIVWSSQP